MRTKTLLLTAAVAAVGFTASLAQTVYSVNAVGYVNVTLSPGYNLLTNPLNGTNNQINTVVPATNLPDDTECLTWDTALQDFQTFVTSGGLWYTQLGVLTAKVLPPGRGFFIHTLVGTNIPITFVGDVPQGNLTNVISANYDFAGSIVPQAAQLTLGLGFTPPVGLTYATFNATAGDYDPTLEFQGVDPSYPSGWATQLGVPANPIPAVAQGFLTSNPSGTTYSWGRTFTVN